jgi:xylulokinase
MPHYDPDARGVLWGLTMEHGRGHVARAIMESVACMLKQDLDYVGAKCSVIRTMGGAAKSPLWCQIKADITGKTLTTLKTDETTLADALLAEELCEGDLDDYGLYIKYVNGIRADYVLDGGYWWNLIVDGETSMVGASFTTVTEGAVYELVRTK